MTLPIPKMEREMSDRNLEFYLENADQFTALSDDDKALLFAGGALEGDTNANAGASNDEAEGNKAEDSSKAPGAANVEQSNETTAAAAEGEPVLLAKDGKNTIPFSVLEEERERARQLEQENLSLKSAIQAATPQKEADAALVVEAKPIDEELAALVKERDEALYTGDTNAAQQLSMKIIGIQQEQATQAAIAAMEARYNKRQAEKQEQDAQANALSDAQARAAALVEKYPFLNPQGPATNQDAIDLVVAQRDRLMQQGASFADAIEQAVAKVAPLFGQVATKQPSNADAAARAAEVISKAKAQVPNSLSQVPAGSAAHHDEGEAVRNDSGLSLINRFVGKSPEEIEKIISRVI